MALLAGTVGGTQLEIMALVSVIILKNKGKCRVSLCFD